eukprot:scaffold124287_cov72-Phaeocystis_antarctica.AAC.1
MLSSITRGCVVRVCLRVRCLSDFAMRVLRARLVALVALVALSAVHAAAHGPKDRANKQQPAADRRAAVPDPEPSASYGFGDWLHYGVAGLEVLFVFACLTSADGSLPGSLLGALFSRRPKYTRCLVALGLVCALEWAAHLLAPLPHVSAAVMILAADPNPKPKPKPEPGSDP